MGKAASTTALAGTKRMHYRAVWFLFVALAWLQLAWAGHQFQHVAGDLGAPCTVCLQLDRLDSVPAEPPVEAKLFRPPLPAGVDNAGPIPATTEPAYSPRAPPGV